MSFSIPIASNAAANRSTWSGGMPRSFSAKVPYEDGRGVVVLAAESATQGDPTTEAPPHDPDLTGDVRPLPQESLSCVEIGDHGVQVLPCLAHERHVLDADVASSSDTYRTCLPEGGGACPRMASGIEDVTRCSCDGASSCAGPPEASILQVRVPSGVDRSCVLLGVLCGIASRETNRDRRSRSISGPAKSKERGN